MDAKEPVGGLFGREALVYADAVALARAAWPWWVVFYGRWTRRTYAIATFLPVAYLTSDTDPRRLGARMRAVEGRRGPVSPERGRAAA